MFVSKQGVSGSKVLLVGMKALGSSGKQGVNGNQAVQSIRVLWEKQCIKDISVLETGWY